MTKPKAKTPKCPSGCDAVQEAGKGYCEPGSINGRPAWIHFRQWRCTKCKLIYGVEEPKPRRARAKKSGGAKGGKSASKKKKAKG